jgi:hypothetical protein
MSLPVMNPPSGHIKERGDIGHLVWAPGIFTGGLVHQSIQEKWQAAGGPARDLSNIIRLNS